MLLCRHVYCQLHLGVTTFADRLQHLILLVQNLPCNLLGTVNLLDVVRLVERLIRHICFTLLILLQLEALRIYTRTSYCLLEVALLFSRAAGRTGGLQALMLGLLNFLFFVRGCCHFLGRYVYLG